MAARLFQRVTGTMRDWDTLACNRVAARPEPVLNFTANMSDDEVDSPRKAAAEPVPEEISCGEM